MLHPKSIAIIGASPDANKLNGRPFHFLQRDGLAVFCAGHGAHHHPVNGNNTMAIGKHWIEIQFHNLGVGESK